MKIYKKGTKVMLWCCTHDFKSKVEEEYILECDMSEDDINGFAEDFMWNTKEPDWGFEVIDKGEE